MTSTLELLQVLHIEDQIKLDKNWDIQLGQDTKWGSNITIYKPYLIKLLELKLVVLKGHFVYDHQIFKKIFNKVLCNKV